MSRRTIDDGIAVSADRRAFSERLTKRMAAANISAAELSRQAKISKDAVSSYTTMRSLPGEGTLKKLARILNCKPTDLLSDEPLPEQPVLEMRTHDKPGFRLLVVRVAVPNDVALEVVNRLNEFSAPVEEGRSRRK